MKLPRFIKLPENRRFNYSPIYYDPRKEALEEKIRKFKAEQELAKTEGYKPDFKGKFRSPSGRNIIKKHNKSANLRLLVIILFIVTIVFIIMQKADLLSYMFNVLFSS